MARQSAPKTETAIKCRWFLADDARSEVGGKVTLLGMYPDDSMVIEMPPEAESPTSEKPIAIEGLTILCVLSGFEGSAEFELRLGPRENGAKQVAVLESSGPGAHLSLISKFRPVLIHSFGQKEFSISSPSLGFHESFVFSIIRRDATARPIGRLVLDQEEVGSKSRKVPREIAAPAARVRSAAQPAAKKSATLARKGLTTKK